MAVADTPDEGNAANRTMDAPAGSAGDGMAAGSGSSGAAASSTLALVDGLFLAVIASPASSSPAGATGRRVVPAIPLQHARSFLSGKVVNVATGGAAGGFGSIGEVSANDAASCIASAPNRNNTTATEHLEQLLVDLPLHRHSHIKFPTREGLVRAHVDCEDGILVEHEARTRPASKSSHAANETGSRDSILISLKRPRAVTAASGTMACEDFHSDLLRVKNAAGSLTADFLGVGGLDQVLLLPPSSLASAYTYSNDGDDTSMNQDEDRGAARQALAGLVAGCALTDGTSVILPHSLDPEDDPTCKKILRTSSDGTRALRLPSIHGEHWKEVAKVMGKGSSTDTSMHVESPHSSKRRAETIDESSSSSHETDGGLSQSQQQPWRAKLTKALHSRLEAEERASKRRRLDQEVRRELVRRSRRALEGLNASNGDGSTGSTSTMASGVCKPAMIRLRYGTTPLLSHGESNRGSSVGISLNVCVDVAFTGSGSATSAGLDGLHLSFSPASSQDSPSAMIKSLSGTVPRLEPGDCVSIMASVDITGLNGIVGIRKSKRNNDEDGGFELAVSALWSNRSATGNGVGDKKGCILGTLKLSYEAMILPSSTHGSQTRRLTHEVDWSSKRNGNATSTSKTMRPTAVFEYRDPRVITIDVTKSNDSADVAGENLRDMVESLNFLVMAGSGGRNCVELCYSSSPSSFVVEHPRIIVLAQCPEERVGLVRLVLKNLPDSAKIVGTASGGEIDRDAEQKKIMNAFLLCIRQEAKLIDAHRRSAPENMGLATLGDLAATQIKTDEVASRIIRKG